MSDGKVLVVGDFTQFNSQSRVRAARLNSDGTLDASFDTGVGPNSAVYTLDLQDDGKILIGGDFTSISGLQRNRIARLNVNGSLDESFKTGDGADGAVYSVVFQPEDGRVLIAGAFSHADLQPRNGIARINGDPRAVPIGVITITSIASTPTGVVVTFDSQRDVSYGLEISSDLVNWTQLTIISANGGVSTVTADGGSSAQFYRIHRLSP